jgi:hypothetical protein
VPVTTALDNIAGISVLALRVHFAAMQDFGRFWGKANMNRIYEYAPDADHVGAEVRLYGEAEILEPIRAKL